jgi:hypothetical protein
VLYQSGQNDEIAAFVLGVLVAHGARVGASKEPGLSFSPLIISAGGNTG